MPDETDLDKSYESIFKMKSFNREQAVSNLNRIIEMKDRKYSNFKSGNIVLEDFSYSYINKPPILKNLSLEIESGQKIGIIGRTGAGKSSLISALYRIRNPATGKILFDGQDEIDLHSLRMGFKEFLPTHLRGWIRKPNTEKIYRSFHKNQLYFLIQSEGIWIHLVSMKIQGYGMCYNQSASKIKSVCYQMVWDIF